MNTPGSEDRYPPCPVARATVDACPHECGECLLPELPDGARTRVRQLRGGRHLRSRLYALGLVPGTEITMCGHGDSGCRVQVRDTCVVLDGESANSVLCDEACPICADAGRHGGSGLRRFLEHCRHGRKGGHHD